MDTKAEKIKSFDPNGLATGNNLFGLPFNEDESDIVVLPVPWEVTVSYRAGTARAPKAILAASRQVDLYDADVADAWQRGISMRKTDKAVSKMSKTLRKKVEKYLQHITEPGNEYSKVADEVNKAGAILKGWVKNEMKVLLAQKKIPVLLGGDHSTPLGFMEALAETYDDFGILQIDAHCDLREAYEGFRYSHASIMFNALKIPQVTKLVQVGTRDCCEEEISVINNSDGRVKTFFDAEMKRALFEGTKWKFICDSIVKELPENVYISFDIDGLDPTLCPHTGTPVPGGLGFEQAIYLLRSVALSGKRIIGCDLNEVVPGEDEWDANVGARLLYKMCNLMGKSRPADG